MSIFNKAWDWLRRNFVSIEQHAAHAAVAIAQVAKEALENGSLDVLAKGVDIITKSNLGDEAEMALKLALPKIIAVSVAIETHPTESSSEEDVLAWERKVMDAFGVHSNKSMIYSLLAAQTFGVLNSLKKQPAKPTLWEWMKACQTIYEDYKKDTAE